MTLFGAAAAPNKVTINWFRYLVLTTEYITSKNFQSKKDGKDQESIQSSTTPDPGYQWESDNFTIRKHKREPRGHPFPSRWPQGIKKQMWQNEDRNTKEALPWNGQVCFKLSSCTFQGTYRFQNILKESPELLKLFKMLTLTSFLRL